MAASFGGWPTAHDLTRDHSRRSRVGWSRPLPAEPERNDEDERDREVAEDRNQGNEQTQEDEPHIAGQAWGEPPGEDPYLLVCGVRPDEVLPDGVSPHRGDDDGDQEQIGAASSTASLMW